VDGLPIPTTEHRGDSESTDPQIAFAELSSIMLGAQPLGMILERIAELAHQAIPGAGAASVTLLDGAQTRSVAFTGGLASGLDERQYDAGFGPCMDAARTGTTIIIPDTATDQKYPDFSREARRHGVTNIVSIGLPVAERTIGALNIYGLGGERSGPFDEEALVTAKAFAHYAAVALANAALFTSTSELVTHLQTALDSRAVIDQAKGILMGQTHCTADEAFRQLARRSQESNVKLRDVAAEIVRRAQTYQ
jgi:GAF domain-containing protein